jgi:DNA replication and repair protein RecF
VLTGPNGAGKTNLLEALSFLAPGRGLRRARLAEVARRNGTAHAGELAWAVAATVETPDGPIELGTGCELVAGDPGAEPTERRVLRIDGAGGRSQAALAETLSVAWLTPELDRLFLESASGRRRFLDRLVYGIDPAHASRLSAYERAMRERSRLLREGRGDAPWLAALETTMAETGVAVTAARAQMVALLNRAGEDRVGTFPQAAAAMTGMVDTWLAELPALAAEDTMREALAGSRAQDAETGGAAHGPHRSDLAVRHAGRGVPAAECSTGEQKALLIALVLAHARILARERGAAPLLLLDEIVAHLDAERRRTLYDEITSLRAQAWLTGTDRQLFEGLEGRAQFMEVAGGVVTPAAAR